MFIIHTLMINKVMLVRAETLHKLSKSASLPTLILMVLWLVMPSLANAQSLSHWLQAEKEVANQTRTERQRELPNLFRDVLVRASGTTAVLDDSVVRNEIREVNDYLLQFGYRREGNQTLLQASFDEQRVRQLLQRAGFPLWTGERPQLLLWVAEDSQERGVRLVGRAEQRPFLQGLYQEAERRGMRMLMPLMDLEDQLAVGPRDVWGRFQREVLRASERYPVAGVVSARMYPLFAEAENGDDASADNRTSNQQQPSGFRLEAIIVIGEREFVENIEAENEEALARAFVNSVTDRVASLFIGATDDESGALVVRMSGFSDIGQLLAAEQMLQQQGQVEMVNLRRYQNGVAEFSLRVNGGVAWLTQALAFERRVQALPQQPVNPDETPILEYRWLR